MTETSYVSDWSPVSPDRYHQAQKAEREYWSQKDREILNLKARYYFYAGYYSWTTNRGLLNPFCVSPSRPENFQIASDAMEGRDVLDVGCGPTTPTISLVHCASVHVVDPLVDLYQEIQPFGWKFFSSVSSAGGEQLPFESDSFHFAYCWNVLDHVQDADRVVSEVARVLRPDGRLLLGCHVRRQRGGGPPHPYRWDVQTLEARLLSGFKPVRPATLLDVPLRAVSPAEPSGDWMMWVCDLQKSYV
jgi:SAM-dependent methyltransferase